MAKSLNALIYPHDGGARPLLVVHGLFGAARNWAALSKRFAQKRTVIAVDLRNHGESPWAESHSYQDLADDLAETILQHGGQMDVLGHSMGGKAAMVLALTAPQTVSRLIVGDIAPVTYNHSQSQYITAMRALDLTPLTRRSEADRAFGVSDPALRAFLLQSLDFTQKPPQWRLNIDVLERYMDQILSFPPLTTRFEGKTLFLSGKSSDYVTSDGKAAAKALFPNAAFSALKEAGHWLHVDAPAAFIATTETFLEN